MLPFFVMRLCTIYKQNVKQTEMASTSNSQGTTPKRHLSLTQDDPVDDKTNFINKKEVSKINLLKSNFSRIRETSWKAKGIVTRRASLQKHDKRDKNDEGKSKEPIFTNKVDAEDCINVFLFGLNDDSDDDSDSSDEIVVKTGFHEIIELEPEANDNALAGEITSGNDSSRKDILNKKSIFKASKEASIWNHRKHWCCICINRLYLQYTIIYSTVLMLIWEPIDITIDFVLFFQLEKKNVIHENIYRNIYVSNAIFVFAVLGCLKIIYWFMTWKLIMKIEESRKTDRWKVSRSELLDNYKLWLTGALFVLEDGPELFLEYFFVEKYMSKQLTWYLIVRDIILCVISLRSIIKSVRFLLQDLRRVRQYIGAKNVKKRMISKICECIVLNSASFLIGLLMILRACGAAYQYATGKLQRSCFTVENGFLLQTPFTGGCMSEGDQAIWYLSGISLFCGFLAFLVLNHVLRIALLSK